MTSNVVVGRFYEHHRDVLVDVLEKRWRYHDHLVDAQTKEEVGCREHAPACAEMLRGGHCRPRPDPDPGADPHDQAYYLKRLTAIQSIGTENDYNCFDSCLSGTPMILNYRTSCLNTIAPTAQGKREPS
jgi:hypothetical protein